MTTKAQYTPTPWRYRTPAHPHERTKITSDAKLDLGFVGEIGQTEKFWADMIGTKLGKPTPGLLDRIDEDRANAAFIVRACNAHADLVLALSEVIAACEAKGIGGDCLDVARAALAKATAI